MKKFALLYLLILAPLSLAEWNYQENIEPNTGRDVSFIYTNSTKISGLASDTNTTLFLHCIPNEGLTLYLAWPLAPGHRL